MTSGGIFRVAADRLDPRDNALNLLRLLLAVVVIVSHSFPVGGFRSDPMFGGLELGRWAVGGFFAISGFLITGSRLNLAVPAYLWRRFLRIFPGYWVCLVVTAFGFALVAGAVRGGWSWGDAVIYVTANADMVAGTNVVGGTLAGAPLGTAWNGSLWTLQYEVASYLVVAVALCFAVVRERRSWTVAAFVLVTAVSVAAPLAGVDSKLVTQGAMLGTFFAAGAVMLRFADRLPLTARGATVASGALLVVAVFGEARSLAALPVAYLCLFVAARAPQWAKQVGSRNDLSYGMYLYGFPVQQLLVLGGAHRLGVVSYTLLAVLCTAPFAVVSWFGVERPAMSLKRYVRGGTGQRVAAMTAPS